MPEQGNEPVQDKNYNLIAVLQQSLANSWQMETYAQDAEQAGDSEIARWFRRIQENNAKASEQGKQLLARRLNEER